MPDYTVKNMPPLPEGYGPEIWRGPTPNKPHVWLGLGFNGWQVGDKASNDDFIYALKSKPWYPPSWFGPDGKPLGRIVEHPGGWPTECGPGDIVMALYAAERHDQSGWDDSWRLASAITWQLIVAYMIKPEDDDQ